MLIKTGGAVFGLFVVLTAVHMLMMPVPAISGGNGAVVFNDSTCHIRAFGSVWTGHSTGLENHGGQALFTCEATLTSGPGVAAEERIGGTCTSSVGTFPGEIVFTKSGQANASCHK
jgi:hypothetical protein